MSITFLFLLGEIRVIYEVLKFVGAVALKLVIGSCKLVELKARILATLVASILLWIIMSSNKLQEEEMDFETDTSGKRQSFNFEEFLFENKITVTLVLLGLILLGVGVFFIKNDAVLNQDAVEVLESTSGGEETDSGLVVEIAGAVEKPGVYKLDGGARVEDLLITAGGLSELADRDWVDLTINRAAKLIDGQKVFIPNVDQSFDSAQDKQSDVKSANSDSLDGNFSIEPNKSLINLINVNKASQKELESLNGIGPVYAQSIIEHRPYSSPEELVGKDAIPKHVFEKIKDKVTIY